LGIDYMGTGVVGTAGCSLRGAGDTDQHRIRVLAEKGGVLVDTKNPSTSLC
jgi:hypothetical protein